jgi:hypothetical protein
VAARLEHSAASSRKRAARSEVFIWHLYCFSDAQNRRHSTGPHNPRNPKRPFSSGATFWAGMKGHRTKRHELVGRSAKGTMGKPRRGAIPTLARRGRGLDAVSPYPSRIVPTPCWQRPVTRRLKPRRRRSSGSGPPSLSRCGEQSMRSSTRQARNGRRVAASAVAHKTRWGQCPSRRGRGSGHWRDYNRVVTGRLTPPVKNKAPQKRAGLGRERGGVRGMRDMPPSELTNADRP